jgi:hypothetical protein
MRRIILITCTSLLAGCEEAAVDTPYTPTTEEIGKFWLGVIFGAVLLFILVAVACYDNNGRRRNWFENFGTRRHSFTQNIASQTELFLRRFHRKLRFGSKSPPPDLSQDRSSPRWIRVIVALAVCAVVLVGISILVEHLTRSQRWFLISWRSFGIHW